MKTFELKATEQQVNVVMNVLRKQPLEVVEDTYYSLIKQVQEQSKGNDDPKAD